MKQPCKEAILFLGPSLPLEDARRELPADYRPPAAQGDVLRAVLEKPPAIGLIDGYFERVPAVWHKEILWALTQGIPVFGSASMGALRAAELEMFGMEGVGRIFEMYRSQEIEDDDEVALVHGLPEDGYRGISEPLVNIRATLEAAEAEGLIGTENHRALLEIARALPYPQRHYEPLFQRAAEDPSLRAAVEALRAWLPEGRVDQKREDALALLRRMRSRLEDGWKMEPVRFTFQPTNAWEGLWKSVVESPPEGASR